jgi:hypothetical protein
MSKIHKKVIIYIFFSVIVTMPFLINMKKPSSNTEDISSACYTNPIESKLIIEKKIKQPPVKSIKSYSNHESPLTAEDSYNENNIHTKSNLIGDPLENPSDSFLVDNFLNAHNNEYYKEAWLDLESRLNDHHVISLITTYATETNDEIKTKIRSFLIYGTSQGTQAEEIISDEFHRDDSVLAADVYACFAQLSLMQPEIENKN